MATRWKYKVDNKMRGAFGETDYDKKTIRINKKLHRKAKKKTSDYSVAKQDSTLINTIVHEMLHKNHPKWTEKRIGKEARVRVAKMNAGQKRSLYSKFT